MVNGVHHHRFLKIRWQVHMYSGGVYIYEYMCAYTDTHTDQSTPCIKAMTGFPARLAGIRPVADPDQTNAVPRVPPSQMLCFPPRRG